MKQGLVISVLGLAAAALFLLQNNPQAVPPSCPQDLHYSYFSTAPFFDEAYEKAPTSSVAAPVYGVTVNHHLLAANLIAQTIGTIATTAPVTVILISPNHFAAGKGAVITSTYQWRTPYGMLESDCRAIEKLSKAGVFSIEEGPFTKEHGVSGIVPFIKKSLPSAKVVPIIIKDNTDLNILEELVDALYGEFGVNAVVVGSFDFSHYVTPDVARIQDKKSIEVIEGFDLEALQSIHIDSIPGIEVVLRYMQKAGATHFSLLVNSNAADILKKPYLPDTTSYINGVFLKP